jgi:hypothetical protein
MQTDFNHLVNIAIDTIWCSPEQDKQYIFKPKRISQPQGSVNRVYMLDEFYTLPLKSARMHVYQLVTAPLTRFNIDLATNTWKRCDVIASQNNMLITVYTENGILRPLEDCWLIHTETKALILAVAVNRKVEFDTTDTLADDDLYTQPVFIRFYSNHYNSLPESAWTNRDVEIFGRLLKTQSDVLAMNQFYTSKLSMAGKVYGQVNGISYPAIVPANYAIGDYVEMIYDSSISEIQVIPLANAPAFESTMDNVNKYLINPGINANSIRFYDDFDFYLTKLVGGSHRGAYLHRNSVQNIRMVTHDTYSIPDPYLQAVAAGHKPVLATDIRSLYIVIVYRNAMSFRNLVDVHNRVSEMYRLNTLLDNPIILKDPNIALTEWKMASLESSYYNAAMRLPYNTLTNAAVSRAFGYHSLAKRLGKSLHARSGANIELPVGVRSACTVFEYDSSGYLLGYYPHTVGISYVFSNPNCTKIEVVSGLATTNYEFQQVVGNNTIEAGVGYRLYRMNGQNIEDVTRLTNLYSISTANNGTRTVSWAVSGNFFIANDKYFPMIDFTFTSGEPLLSLTLQGAANSPLKIPLTDIDVWLNGKLLVETIDYIVKYPSILVCCAKHVLPLGQANRVIVRARGLRSGSSYRSTAQTGFIEYGLLSNNQVEDFHGDQNLRIVANGGIRLLEEVTYNQGGGNTYLNNSLYYSEDANLGVATISSGNNLVTLGVNSDHPLNGIPYSIRDNYVGLSQWVAIDPVELREEAIGFDQRMNQFVTANRTRTKPTVNNNVLVPYRLFSPTIASIIRDLLADQIPHQAYRKDALNKQEIATLLAPWLGILSQDPAESNNYRKFDSSVVRIHPHPYTTAVEIDTYSWRLLEFISEQFLGGRVDVSLDILINDAPNPNQW